MADQQTHYWLFIVMDGVFPDLWNTFLKRGLAAQDYSPEYYQDEPNLQAHAKRNRTALEKLKAGDWIVAAFKAGRFGGYARLTSALLLDSPPLNLATVDGRRFPFHEQFRCDWTAIPMDADGNAMICDCSDLRRQGYDIRLNRAMCIKQTDEKTFLAIKACLDNAGAVPHGSRR